VTLENLPTELTRDRSIIEGNFVMSLWLDPENYLDYKINPEKDLFTEDAKFYYGLGLELYKQGYKNFDDISICVYLANKDILRNGYERRGGYRPIHDFRNILNINNIDSYYDNLCKSNMLINLYDKGFNILKNIDKLKSMTSEQVYDYYDYLLNNIAIDKSTDIKIEKLNIDDAFIEECNSGAEMGLNYGKYAHLLNYITLGIPKGDLFLIAGYSGIGKTSWAFANVVLPIIENGHKVCIISNEQKANEFKRLLLSMTLYDLGYYNLSRKKLKQGSFSTEQMAIIEEDKNIINEKYDETLRFVKMYDYSLAKIKKIVKKLSKQGYELFVYDTMKGENLSDGQVWQQLVEDSKQLFQLASKENVAIVPTYQLALHSLGKRHLDATCLSNAKQIKEVFSEIILFRTIYDDEYDGEAKDIKPYHFEKDKETGKWTGNKIYKKITKDINKKYLIVFVDKTRNDVDGQTIVYEFNGAWNKWMEIGYCTVLHDF
jgi:replicative DNA helicase